MWIKLCRYAKHLDKYSEQERWDHFVSVSILFNPEFYISAGGSLVAQLVKNLLAMWETWV